ncbi:hypothetical protein GCM10020331_087040 [Ectobacillus funiculus]
MKKAVSALLALTTAVGLLAGCSSDAQSTSSKKRGCRREKKVELKLFIAQPRFKAQYEKVFGAV